VHAAASSIPSPGNLAASLILDSPIRWLPLHLTVCTRIVLPSVASPRSPHLLPSRSCPSPLSINLLHALHPTISHHSFSTKSPSSSQYESHVVDRCRRDSPAWAGQYSQPWHARSWRSLCWLALCHTDVFFRFYLGNILWCSGGDGAAELLEVETKMYVCTCHLLQF
jgi:hypothetical protein